MFNVTLQDGLSVRSAGPTDPVFLEIRTSAITLTARLTGAGESTLRAVLQHRYNGDPLPEGPGTIAVPVPPIDAAKVTP